MWDLSSITKDQTCAPALETQESQPMDCQGSPNRHYYNFYFLDEYIQAQRNEEIFSQHSNQNSNLSNLTPEARFLDLTVTYRMNVQILWAQFPHFFQFQVHVHFSLFRKRTSQLRTTEDTEVPVVFALNACSTEVHPGQPSWKLNLCSF